MSEFISYRWPEMAGGKFRRILNHQIMFTRNGCEDLEIVPKGGIKSMKKHAAYKMGKGKLGVAVPEHDDSHYMPQKHRAKVVYALVDADDQVIKSEEKILSEGDHIDLEFDGVTGVITHTPTRE